MAVINMRLPELEENNGPVQLTDTAPYLYRQAPIITEKLSDKLVGGTVALNQIVRNGNFADDFSGWNANASYLSTQNGVLTITKNENTGAGVGYARRTDVDLVVGHKYLYRCDYKGIQGKQLALFTNSINSGMTRVVPPDSNWHSKEIIFNVLTLPTIPCIFWLNYETTTGDNTAQFRNINYFDLTALFGPTIADYLYNLETATPGAGVALFRNLFPDDYYAYNAGELISVKTSAHKTVGFNQWDEEWELGSYNPTTGEPEADTDRIRCKNKIEVIPNASYYFKAGESGQTTWQFRGIWLDANENVLSDFYIRNTARSAPSGTRYLKFWTTGGYGTSYHGNDICINISDPSKNGTYEPYEEHVYPLDNDLELRGIPKLDAENNLYYDGDVYESSGTVTRKFGVVDLGTLTWGAASSYGTVYRAGAPITNAINGNPSTGTTAPIISDKYTPTYRVTDTPNVSEAGLIGIRYNNVYVTFAESKTAAEVKAALSGSMLVYRLATETTESADPFTDPQDSGYTEQYIDERAVPVPVGHETTYFDMIQNVVIPMALPMYDDAGAVVIPMALPFDTTQEE